MKTIRLDSKAKLNVVRVCEKDLDLFPQLIGNAVIVSERAVREHLLTSAPVICLRHDFYYRGDSIARLVSDSDGICWSEEDKQALDDCGLVKLGTEVRSGSVLAVAIQTISAEKMTAEEKLHHAIFGLSGTERDCSPRYHLNDPGTVSQVRLLARDLPPGVSWRIEVEVVLRRELRVGDTLSFDDGIEATVAAIVPQDEMNYLFRGTPVDILVGPDLPRDLRGSGLLRHHPGKRWHNWFKTTGEVIRVAKKTQQVEKKVESRSTGTYSLVSQQPLGSGTHPAQPVSWELVGALLQAGYPENVRELLTIKSDAVEGRSKAYEALIKGEEVPLDKPWSTTRLEYILRALGFTLKLGDDSLEIAPMSDAERRQLSRGEVKSGKTINYRSYRCEPDGILCERIFGPERDYECSCGKYQGSRHKGVVCEKCGVEVTTNCVRRERFGHIVLTKPVVHPWFLPKIAEILGMELAALRELIYDAHAEGDLDEAKSRLEELGVNTDGLIMKTLLVLPPGFRPFVPLEDGSFATFDLNDLYRRVINRSSRLGKLVDLNVPAVIIRNETRMLQQSVDAVFDNLACPHPVLAENGRPLCSLKEELAVAVEAIRNKRADYSARAVAVPDAAVAAGTIGLPLPMAIELFQPLLIRALKETGQADTIKSARILLKKSSDQSRELVEWVVNRERVLVVTEANKISALAAVIKDGEALRLNPADAKALELNFANSQLKIYCPLRQAAKDELVSPRPMAEAPSNLTLDHLLAAALEGNTIKLTPADRILLGIG